MPALHESMVAICLSAREAFPTEYFFPTNVSEWADSKMRELEEKRQEMMDKDMKRKAELRSELEAEFAAKSSKKEGGDDNV